MLKKLKLLLFILIAITLIGCNDSDEIIEETIKVGFIPSENMEEVTKNAQPLVNMLSEALGREVEPFIATDYTGIVEAFRAGKLDIGFLSPAAYVMAKNEADVKVILKAVRNGKSVFYSAIITRTDSGINTLEDFKDRSFSFGDALSTSGNIFPKKVFIDNNINPTTDFSNLIYSGGHDATVLAVLNKKVDGGATFCNDTTGNDGAWTQFLKPEEANQIKAIAYSDPIPADNISISKNLDPEVLEKLEKVFLDLSQDPEGQALIQKLYRIDGFERATDDDYQSVRDAFKIAGIDLKKELTNE